MGSGVTGLGNERPRLHVVTKGESYAAGASRTADRPRGQSRAVRCCGVATVPGIDASRLWSEIQRVTTVQYQFGTEADVKAAREAVRVMIEGLFREYPKGSGPLYAKYAEALDVLGERQKAEEAFAVGRRLYPDDRDLAAVASLRAFSVK